MNNYRCCTHARTHAHAHTHTHTHTHTCTWQVSWQFWSFLFSCVSELESLCKRREKADGAAIEHSGNALTPPQRPEHTRNCFMGVTWISGPILGRCWIILPTTNGTRMANNSLISMPTGSSVMAPTVDTNSDLMKIDFWFNENWHVHCTCRKTTCLRRCRCSSVCMCAWCAFNVFFLRGMMATLWNRSLLLLW